MYKSLEQMIAYGKAPPVTHLYYLQWDGYNSGIQYTPAIRGDYVPSSPANPEKPRIIDAVLKRGWRLVYEDVGWGGGGSL